MLSWVKTMIKELSISGFRGFGQRQTVGFALPDGEKIGSGLSIITGANNSGKTTIIEAIRAFNGNDSPSFSEGRRNVKTGGVVELELLDSEENSYTIKSVAGGGSSTTKNRNLVFQPYILQSRRAMSYEFSRNNWDKNTYMSIAQKLDNQRGSSLQNFEARLFQIETHKESFNGLLNRILGPDFQWTIEQRDGGSYYIKCSNGRASHSSEGIGDGVWSIFTICAALFDAPENSVIVIDEPELSVHPAMQRRLMNLLLEYSKDRQIIISTHSPYFISWRAITNGAKLIRVVKEENDSKCFCLSDECDRRFAGMLRELDNPHILGIEANETFFLEDRIILVEGQEDVVIYQKIARELNIPIKGSFFGWGAGGAEKMKIFLMLFRDLGYRHVVALLDGDKHDLAEDLRREFAETGYTIMTLETDDIRDKSERHIPSKTGIANQRGHIKDEYQEYIIRLFDEINEAML